MTAFNDVFVRWLADGRGLIVVAFGVYLARNATTDYSWPRAFALAASGFCWCFSLWLTIVAAVSERENAEWLRRQRELAGE